MLPFLFTFLKINGTLVVAIDENLLECRRLDERRFFLKVLTYIQMPPLITDNGTIYDLYPKSPPSSSLFQTSKNSNTVILEYCLDNVANMFPDSTEQMMIRKFKDELELKPNTLRKLCRGRIRNLVRSKFEYEDPNLKLQYFARNFMSNFKYELQRIKITHLSLTSCCLKKDSLYSRTDLASKLNCKFKDYHKATEMEEKDCTVTNSKKGKF